MQLRVNQIDHNAPQHEGRVNCKSKEPAISFHQSFNIEVYLTLILKIVDRGTVNFQPMRKMHNYLNLCHMPCLLFGDKLGI